MRKKSLRYVDCIYVHTSKEEARKLEENKKREEEKVIEEPVKKERTEVRLKLRYWCCSQTSIEDKRLHPQVLKAL